MTTRQATVHGSRGRSAAVVATTALVALAIWGLARALGVELAVGKGDQASRVGAADVPVAVLVAGVAAWLVQRLLVRRGAAGWWPFVGSTALAISIIGPTWLADGMASVVLIGMHLAVGLVLIAGFNHHVKTLSRGDDDAASLHDRRTGPPAASHPGCRGPQPASRPPTPSPNSHESEPPGIRGGSKPHAPRCLQHRQAGCLEASSR